MKIDSAREGYRSAAIRASVAYFVLDDLSRVDPMYQVSQKLKSRNRLHLVSLVMVRPALIDGSR